MVEKIFMDDVRSFSSRADRPDRRRQSHRRGGMGLHAGQVRTLINQERGPGHGGRSEFFFFFSHRSCWPSLLQKKILLNLPWAIRSAERGWCFWLRC